MMDSFDLDLPGPDSADRTMSLGMASRSVGRHLHSSVSTSITDPSRLSPWEATTPRIKLFPLIEKTRDPRPGTRRAAIGSGGSGDVSDARWVSIHKRCLMSLARLAFLSFPHQLSFSIRHSLSSHLPIFFSLHLTTNKPTKWYILTVYASWSDQTILNTERHQNHTYFINVCPIAITTSYRPQDGAF